MRKKIIDIITENNFKEVSSTPANIYSIMFDAEGKDKVICRANCKIFTYVDDEYVLLDTGVTLKAYYYEKYEDINNEIQIHRANRLIFEGKIDTEEEFKTLLKMLSL